MGSYIHLRLGEMVLCWGKDWSFIDYSQLFRATDVRPAPYHYVDDNGEPIVKMKEALVRPLREALPRLELLGYNLDGCRRRYDEVIETQAGEEASANPDFDAALALAKSGESIPIEFNNPIEFLDPLLYLRMLAEVPENLDLDLVWEYADVVDGGYVTEDDIIKPLARKHQFLVVTEGTSDTMILRDSLSTVAPDLDDFFTFVDMADNYPFTGAGNLVNFCAGLAKIGISGKVLVLLDNDTEGRFAYQRIAKLALPHEMGVMLLPSLEEFRSVTTLGPNGESAEDVNGRAVAIECFLDLKKSTNEEPKFRWTTYNKALDSYQGELVDKEAYNRRFRGACRDPCYDYSKLKYLWQEIVRVCSRPSARDED